MYVLQNKSNTDGVILLKVTVWMLSTIYVQQCSMLIFFYVLFLDENQRTKPANFQKKQFFFRILEIGR